MHLRQYAFWLALSGLLAACTTPVTVSGAFHRKVRYGQPNIQPGEEYVVSFKKAAKDNVKIERVLVADKGRDLLAFTNPSPADSTFSKTYSSTEGLTGFSILLRTERAVRQAMPAVKPGVTVFYLLNGHAKQLTVGTVAERKEIRLR